MRSEVARGHFPSDYELPDAQYHCLMDRASPFWLNLRVRDASVKSGSRRRYQRSKALPHQVNSFRKASNWELTHFNLARAHKLLKFYGEALNRKGRKEKPQRTLRKSWPDGNQYSPGGIYNRLRENPGLKMVPRTFFFAGKAAPAYKLAKLIIRFINNLGGTIDGDPASRDRLNVVFLPEYNVSLVERLIPASDVSNQISTAGCEASGTSNMKFMMNGALTVGTRDGATIEMAEESGEENMFLYGLTVEQVEASRSWYNPYWHYENEPGTRAALDLIFSDHFSRNEPGVFAPLRDTLLTQGDHYMHLADLTSYCNAQDRLGTLYSGPGAWAHKAILNVASSGKFSSDRSIEEYASEIWKVKPCPVV
jgi:hypothetical protein